MKSLKLVIAICALVAFSNVASAQMKIAHINSAELVELLPEVKKIQDSLQALSVQYKETLEAIEKELTQKQTYWENNPSSNPTVVELREREYQDIVTRYQRTQQAAQEDVVKKQEEMFKPVIEGLKETIIEVAKSKGYDYVLDATEGGGLIYGSESHDLMKAVKAKLNIE